MTLKVLAMQAGGGDSAIPYSALDVRALFDALVPTEGVIGATSLKVSQRAAGADFSVDVAAGFAMILGDDVALQGKYLCLNTAVVNLAIPTPPVSGSRIHRVIARVKDKLHNGSWSTYEWTLEVLPDVGSGTPALPDSAITLALVTVAVAQANVSDANINHQRPNALLWPSRPHQIGSDADRPENPVAGERIYRTDRPPLMEVFDGSAWRLDGSAGVVFAERTSDLNRASNTVLADDTQLLVTLPANVNYVLEAALFYTADAAADFRFQFLVPSGGSFTSATGALPSGSTGSSGSVSQDRQVEGLPFIGGGSGATVMTVRVLAKVWSGAGGTFKLQWAQSVSSGTATVLLINSFMVLRPVS